jgi:hypothetical protein
VCVLTCWRMLKFLRWGQDHATGLGHSRMRIVNPAVPNQTRHNQIEVHPCSKSIPVIRLFMKFHSTLSDTWKQSRHYCSNFPIRSPIPLHQRELLLKFLTRNNDKLHMNLCACASVLISTLLLIPSEQNCLSLGQWEPGKYDFIFCISKS